VAESGLAHRQHRSLVSLTLARGALGAHRRSAHRRSAHRPSTLSWSTLSWSAVCLIAVAAAGLPTSAVLGQQPTDDETPLTTGEESTTGAGEQGGDPDDQRARELYLRGDRLYAEGRYEDAVAAFRESYELSRQPALQFNLANAYERLGRYEEAMAALRAYAPHAPEYDRDTIARRIRALEVRVEQPSTSAEPDPGEPSVTPRSSVDLSPAPAGRRRISVPGLVLVGVGVAALVAAGIFGALSLSAHGDLESACPTGVCSDAVRNDVDRERTFALVADIGFIVGGLAALVGTGFLIWDTGE
jgi:hypothetical protein